MLFFLQANFIYLQNRQLGPKPHSALKFQNCIGTVLGPLMMGLHVFGDIQSYSIQLLNMQSSNLENELGAIHFFLRDPSKAFALNKL